MGQSTRWEILLLVVFTGLSLGDPLWSQDSYTKHHLSRTFHCEGAYYGDFNRDGNLDIVSGPVWYAGPEFRVTTEIHAPVEYDPHGYSENFLTYCDDFNGDGWPDVLYVPWPGKDAFWYENPGKETRANSPQPWRSHRALTNVGNESPAWTDINADGRPELVFNIDGFLGYATWDPAQPEEMWKFHPISERRDTYQRYTHGLGCGDLNGDGRVDVVEAAGWWEQPQQITGDQPWKWHEEKFAEAGAQMLVYDIDGDGLKDVVTSWHCHHYGLVWHRQLRTAGGKLVFLQHEILSPTPQLGDDEFRISQMHALTMADMNGDGLEDIVTGKRYWAHGPQGDSEPGAPAVLYWFELQRGPDRDAQFIPHRIDNDSGVGTQVTAVDLNQDRRPDVVVGNKKGTFLFLSRDLPE